MQEVQCSQEQVTFDDNLRIDLKYADDAFLIVAAFEHLYLSTCQ